MSTKLASRMDRLGTETAFEVLVRAKALEAQGRDIVHLEIGEPDFDTPENIVEAGATALRSVTTTARAAGPAAARFERRRPRRQRRRYRGRQRETKPEQRPLRIDGTRPAPAARAVAGHPLLEHGAAIELARNAARRRHRSRPSCGRGWEPDRVRRW